MKAGVGHTAPPGVEETPALEEAELPALDPRAQDTRVSRLCCYACLPEGTSLHTHKHTHTRGFSPGARAAQSPGSHRDAQAPGGEHGLPPRALG